MTSEKLTSTIYDRFQFRVPYRDGKVGDCYDRFMVRMLEMRESIRILKQALDGIGDGPVLGNAPKVFKPKPAEVYGRVEAPKGELGFYLIADGTPKPYRYRVRPPSLINLTVLETCASAKRWPTLSSSSGASTSCLGRWIDEPFSAWHLQGHGGDAS
ncbi:MAG: hypothetical protein CM1200mP29_01460 [Verrucomicrobiota bacterium]|nr:MAG: hypothetical protein CM1200mP29_01460 [Verrucomicrobiota bacterium]